MNIVKVYRYKVYDIVSNETSIRGFATMQFIEQDAKMVVIADSVREVPHTQLTDEGELLETDSTQ